MADVVLLGLYFFSAEGGIETMARITGKALHTVSGGRIKILSLHDNPEDFYNAYFPEKNFHAFNKSRKQFISASVLEGIKARVVVATHSNLLPVLSMIRIINPKVKTICWAHGTEVWDMPAGKKMQAKLLHKFICVGEYTKGRLRKDFPLKKLTVISNCLDIVENDADPKIDIRSALNIATEKKIVLSLCRISARDKYKGFDIVLDALRTLDRKDLHYVIAGRADESEQLRIMKIVTKIGLGGQVTMTGFVSDDMKHALYRQSDIFIMPSTKEGFGLVYIEAINAGLPVIAGNRDGSADAVMQGKFGRLCDPLDVASVCAAIEAQLQDPLPVDIDAFRTVFGYEIFLENVIGLISPMLKN